MRPPYERSVSCLLLSLFAVSCLKAQQPTVEGKSIEAATIAEYKSLGASYIMPDMKGDGIWTYPEEPGSLGAFVFGSSAKRAPSPRRVQFPDSRLPDAKVPFGLFLDRCDFAKDSGLKSLAHLKNLRTLGLRDMPVTDDDLKELAPLDLTTLILVRSKITDAGFKNLASLKNLRTLRVSTANVKGGGLKDLAPLKNLATLDIINADLRADGLKGLAPLTSLTTLSLRFNPRIGEKGEGPEGDAGLIELVPLERLRSLDLTRTNIGDSSLIHLQRLTNLTTLKLSANSIHDRALDRLASLEKLSSLELSLTRISDAGLKKLEQCKNLTSLNVKFCEEVTGDGIAEFEKALPKCKVVWK